MICFVVRNRFNSLSLEGNLLLVNMAPKIESLIEERLYELYDANFCQETFFFWEKNLLGGEERNHAPVLWKVLLALLLLK